MKRRIGEAMASLAAAGAVLWLYWWSLAAMGGLMPTTRVPADNDYYNHLVAGFVQGHLYMDLPVSDALQALPDPYDPGSNAAYRRTDASLYHGKYYLYFGAAPAVTLLLPYRLVTGEYLPTPRAILLFVSVGFLAMAAVYLAIRRRYFAGAPWWTAPVGILLLGVGSTVDVLIRRPFFWELATAGGFAFSMLAITAIYAAIHSERRRGGWIAAAGLLLGLAVASRPTFIYAVPALALPLVAWAQVEGITRRWWHMVIAAAIGIGIIGIATFAYNYARFGNGLEFGFTYQLSVTHQAHPRLFRWESLWFNTRMYFLLPGQWSWHPPFFAPMPVPRSAMPPGFYTVDDPFGLLPIFPATVLALAAPFALIGRSGAERIRLRTTLLAAGLMAVATGLVILLYVATIPRYAVDFFPALMLLVVFGLLVLASAPARRWTRCVVGSTLFALAIVSLATGTLTIFNLGQLLGIMQPDRLARIATVTRRFEALQDQADHVHYGPIELQVRFDNTVTTEARPLLTAGPADKPDRILVERASPRQVRFAVQHDAALPQWSRAVTVDATSEHRLWVDLGSFYPGLDHQLFADAGYTRASWLEHRAEIKLDGQTVLRTYAPFIASRRGAPRVVNPAFLRSVGSLHLVETDITGRAIDAPSNRIFEFSVPASSAVHRLPLIASQERTTGDLLFLETHANGRARLGYCDAGAAPIWSDEFSLAPGVTHRLELRQDEGGWSQPERGERLLVAWLDGRLVWNRTAPAVSCGGNAAIIGDNPTATDVERTFPTLTVTTTTQSVRRGGPLLLRVMLPKGVKGSWLPFLCTGHPGASDMLSVNYMSQDAIQFRFDHSGAPLLMGTAAVVDENVGHDIEIFLPSFAPNAIGKPADGEMWVKVDGHEVLRGRTAVYGFSPAELSLGQNTTHATFIDDWFQGAFIKADWLGEPL